jgi:hypothetical protein
MISGMEEEKAEKRALLISSHAQRDKARWAIWAAATPLASALPEGYCLPQTHTSPQGGNMKPQRQQRPFEMPWPQSTITHSSAVGGGAFFASAQ